MEQRTDKEVRVNDGLTERRVVDDGKMEDVVQVDAGRLSRHGRMFD
jgi:hypothetical protein